MVDRRYDVELSGRKFLVSREGGRYGRRSIPLQKAQQDTSDLPGEQSLNPDDLWRRSFESWHRGAGQEYFDWEEGDKFRFRSSLGVDPWTKKHLALLSETEAKLASTQSSVKLAVAGSYLYVADGQSVKFTQDILATGVATWTTLTGTPAATCHGLATDGENIWAAYGSEGVYKTTRGATSAGLYSDTAADIIGYAKGRLMVGTGRTVYNLTSAASSEPMYRGSTTDSTDALAASKTVAVPTGALTGDLLLLHVSVGGTAAETITLSDPTGWSGNSQSVGANGYQYLYYRFIEDGDDTSYTVTFPAARRSIVTLSVYQSVEAPRDAAESASNAVASTTAAGDELVMAHNPDLVVWAATAYGSTNFQVPYGNYVGYGGSPAFLTERIDVATATASVSQSLADYVHTDDSTTTGALDGLMSASLTSSTIGMAFPAKDPPVALATHSSTDFTWVGFAEGQGDIYAAGYSGDKSLIYRTQIRADGTALDALTVAGSLPDGEVVRSIYGYLGILFIGTDQGVRMAVSDTNGDLTFGARIDTPSPVRCFEGQENFVWFGLEDYDVSRWAAGTYDGLGRLDLTQQPSALVPAWASDLMVSGSTSTTESVQSIVTFQNRRVFSIASSDALARGVYGEKANKVATGYLDSGLITYGIADTKVATYLDVRHKALVGDLEAFVSTDEGAFSSIGTSTTANSTQPTDSLPVGPTRGEVHEVRVRLNRDDASDAIGPTVTRLTLRSEPAPTRGRIIQWPLIITKKLNVVGQEVTTDPYDNLDFIEDLFETQTLITCKENNLTFSAFLKDFEVQWEHRTDDKKAEQGICTVVLKSPGG